MKLRRATAVGRVVLHVLAMAALSAPPLFGDWTIDDPTDGESFLNTGAISGYGLDGQDGTPPFTFKIRQSGSTITQYSDTASEAGNWTADPETPMGGYPVADDLTAELWAGSPSAKQVSAGIKTYSN